MVKVIRVPNRELIRLSAISDHDIIFDTRMALHSLIANFGRLNIEIAIGRGGGRQSYINVRTQFWVDDINVLFIRSRNGDDVVHADGLHGLYLRSGLRREAGALGVSHVHFRPGVFMIENGFGFGGDRAGWPGHYREHRGRKNGRGTKQFFHAVIKIPAGSGPAAHLGANRQAANQSHKK